MNSRRGDKKKMKDFISSIKGNPNQYYYIKSNLKKLVSEGVDINTYVNYTLLHLAIRLKNRRLLKMFIEAGVNLNLADESSLSPLHLAVLENRLDFVKLLVQSGCDIALGSELEQTPLHLAVSNGHYEIAKYLLEQQADIWAVDELNNIPLDYAIDEKDSKMINLLLQHQEIDDLRLEKIKTIERKVVL